MRCVYVCVYLLGRRQKAIYRLILRKKNVTPEIYLEIWDSSATLISQLGIVTLFGVYRNIFIEILFKAVEFSRGEYLGGDEEMSQIESSQSSLAPSGD